MIVISQSALICHWFISFYLFYFFISRCCNQRSVAWLHLSKKLSPFLSEDKAKLSGLMSVYFCNNVFLLIEKDQTISLFKVVLCFDRFLFLFLFLFLFFIFIFIARLLFVFSRLLARLLFGFSRLLARLFFGFSRLLARLLFGFRRLFTGFLISYTFDRFLCFSSFRFFFALNWFAAWAVNWCFTDLFHKL